MFFNSRKEHFLKTAIDFCVRETTAVLCLFFKEVRMIEEVDEEEGAKARFDSMEFVSVANDGQGETIDFSAPTHLIEDLAPISIGAVEFGKNRCLLGV